MVKESAVRGYLEEVKADLTANEAEHEMLLNLLKALEGWLRLHGSREVSTPQLPLIPAQKSERIKNPISFRKAIIQVLQESHGEPLREEEIWRRVQALGVILHSKNPVGWIGVVARKSGAEKVAAKTWRRPIKDILAGTYKEAEQPVKE